MGGRKKSKSKRSATKFRATHQGEEAEVEHMRRIVQQTIDPNDPKMRKSRRRSRRTCHAEMRKSRKQSKRSLRMYRSAPEEFESSLKEIIDTLKTLMGGTDSPQARLMRTPVTDNDLNMHYASFQKKIANDLPLNDELRTVIRYFERLPVAMNDEMSEKVYSLLKITRSSMEDKQIQWRFFDVSKLYEERLRVFNDPHYDNLKVWRYILHCLQNRKFDECIDLMVRCNMNTLAAASSPQNIEIRAPPMANNLNSWRHVWDKLNKWLYNWLLEDTSEHFHEKMKLSRTTP